jgi:predicted lipoprotein with Yx(FWY)xxD motif
MLRLIAIGAAAGGLLLAGCGGDDGDDSGTTGASATQPSSTAESPAAPAGKGTTIQISDSDYGQVLFDENDQAIYLFDKEKGSNSECYDDCASAWPPVLTKGDSQAGAGVDAGLLGTTKRDDGTTQVTYNGHPLYYYEGDAPGQVGCQNVSEFGGLWLVVDAKGDAVRGS